MLGAPLAILMIGVMSGFIASRVVSSRLRLAARGRRSHRRFALTASAPASLERGDEAGRRAPSPRPAPAAPAPAAAAPATAPRPHRPAPPRRAAPPAEENLIPPHVEARPFRSRAAATASAVRTPRPGGGWEAIQTPHTHEYAPFDLRLFSHRDGCYYFIGDPRDFGYTGQSYNYYGAHPVHDTYGGGWCFMVGGHYHWWRPWSPYFTVVGPWYYWHGPTIRSSGRTGRTTRSTTVATTRRTTPAAATTERLPGRAANLARPSDRMAWHAARGRRRRRLARNAAGDGRPRAGGWRGTPPGAQTAPLHSGSARGRRLARRSARRWRAPAPAHPAAAGVARSRRRRRRRRAGAVARRAAAAGTAARRAAAAGVAARPAAAAVRRRRRRRRRRLARLAGGGGFGGGFRGGGSRRRLPRLAGRRLRRRVPAAAAPAARR